MKIYEGYRLPDGRCRVVVSHNGHKRPLPPRNKLFNHNPTGFEWGHLGSGPAQLALAFLADHLDNDQLAVQLHQDFKFRKIAGLPRDKAWSVSEDEVAREVAQIKKNRRP